jgi:cytochrome b6-f complex subunit 4
MSDDTKHVEVPAPDPVEDARSVEGAAVVAREPYDPLDQSEAHHKEWGDQPTIKFFQYHVTAEVTNVFLLLMVYLLLAVLFPTGLEMRANPLVTPIGIKPEWYFLFLYAFMHYVPPVVGTMMPLFGLGLLAAWPWIDRNPERAPRRRKIAIAMSFVVIAVILTLSIIGMLD